MPSEPHKRPTPSSPSAPKVASSNGANNGAASVSASESASSVNGHQASSKSAGQNNSGSSQSSAGLFNPTGVKTLLTVTILACICVTGFMTRLFSVIRYESIIHEFDPWFNYRATYHMV
jgi:hypothetical protein